jgi:hypothetical protein
VTGSALTISKSPATDDYAGNTAGWNLHRIRDVKLFATQLAPTGYRFKLEQFASTAMLARADIQARCEG